MVNDPALTLIRKKKGPGTKAEAVMQTMMSEY
jgi:hypothetical protein